MSKPKHSQKVNEEAQPEVPAPEAVVETPEVHISAAEISELQQALEEALAKSKEYFEGWQRERADFSNYKRRIERDQLTLSQSITGEIIKKYLAVLDDMDRAVKMRPAEGDLTVWASGIELIYRKLQNIIDQEGIKRIPAETEEFNPTRHEAITFEDSPDHASGAIIGVVQEGYTLGDRILRPARVRVAR
jgi:molecular chaperone GrpE